MRVLFLSCDYPPNRGGIARLSWELARGLARRHEVRVVASAGDLEEAARFDREQPFPTRRITARLGLREWELFWAVRHELATFRPDVTWSAMWYPEALTLALLARGPAQTLMLHGSEFIPSTATWRKRLKRGLGWLRGLTLRRARRIFAVSRYTRDQAVRLGAPETRVEVLPGGVSEERFAWPARSPDGQTLLTVARLDPYKGQDTVIRALALLKHRFPRLRYLLVGPTTPYGSELMRLAERLEVADRLELRGAVTEARLRETFDEADLYVMVSREEEGYVEGFGLVYLEAAATGLPAVAGRSGGVPDAVEDGVTGVLVDPQDPEAVAAAIARLLEDPKLRLQLGEQARERAYRDFRWDVLAGRLAHSLEGLSTAPRPEP